MNENTTEAEYSLQYFLFTPKTFFEDFTELLLEELTLTVQHTVKQLSSERYQHTNSENVIKNAFQIHNSWIERAEIILKKLEPTIQEIFTIPKNVLLPVYAKYEKQYTAEDIQKLETEIKELKEICEKQKTTIAVYKSEIDLLEHMKPLDKKVDEGIHILNRTKEFFEETKKLELIAQAYKENRKKYFTSDNDDDTEGDDCLALHEWKFKTVNND